jgi:hypothetical protein
MNVIASDELERLVRSTFPDRRYFSAESELGLAARPLPPVAMVHGGPDPYLDRQFDAWIAGSARFVSVYQLLNRLCRAGALPPGDYAVTRHG